eukprot:m.214349 g.214349  ORF g.214349 m.214349 type:complete len:419 (-) comp27122_c0_seq1:207-1463(-)
MTLHQRHRRYMGNNKQHHMRRHNVPHTLSTLVALTVWIVMASFTVRIATAVVMLTPEMQTFGGALKSFPVGPGVEQTLYTFSAPPSQSGAPHTITEQWFSLFGGNEAYDPNVDCRIRVYVDNNGTTADLDFQLFFAHTVGRQSCTDTDGCIDPRVPWSSSEVQHMAHGGALKNRYRIPFSQSIRITATLPPTAKAGIFYYYVRGMTALPVVVGDVQLPYGARLVLHKNEAVQVVPMGALQLVPQRNNSGLLYATIMSAESAFIGFMEGCVRAYIDDRYAHVPLFMSSGTEDYFESANFFNAGHPAPPWTPGEPANEVFNASDETASPESGVSYVKGHNSATLGFNYSMAAYKFHVSDPIVWWKSFKLTASNYDGGGQNPDHDGYLGCVVPASGIPGKSTNVTMWTYAWTYAWTYEWED